MDGVRETFTLGGHKVTVTNPEEVVPRDAAALAWMANLGCLELHPHPVRAEDLEHPDELRVDLDPVPGVKWAQVREVARAEARHEQVAEGGAPWRLRRLQPEREGPHRGGRLFRAADGTGDGFGAAGLE